MSNQKTFGLPVLWLSLLLCLFAGCSKHVGYDKGISFGQNEPPMGEPSPTPSAEPTDPIPSPSPTEPSNPPVGTCDNDPLLPYAGLSLVTPSSVSARTLWAQGQVLISGDAKINRLRSGMKLPRDKNRTDLGVGGQLYVYRGKLPRGNLAHGYDHPQLKRTAVYGGVQQISGLNYDSETQAFEELSKVYSGYASNGSYQVVCGSKECHLNLTGTDAALNVFDLEADIFPKLHQVNVIAPKGSRVIVNLRGAQIKAYGFRIRLSKGLDAKKVVWNLPETKEIEFRAIVVPGTVLAPWAHVTSQGAKFLGAVIAGQARLSYTWIGHARFQLCD